MRRPERRVASEPSSPTGIARDLALLLLLPAALALLGSDWLWGTPTRDAWIYYGYFRRLPVYLATFPEWYFTSRLSVLLPGWLVHSVLPPIAAHLVLHLLLVQTALAAFYLATRRLFGRRTALFTSVALAAHPFFLIALGDNYVDGFGIAYVFLALAVATRAAQGARRLPLLAVAGGLATLLVSANLFYVVFLPLLAGHYVVVRGWPTARVLLREAAVAALGAVAAFAGLCLVNQGLGGRFLYILPSLRFADSLVRQTNPFRWPPGSWVPIAVWLVLPVLVLAGVPAALRRARESRREGLLRWSQIAAVGFFFVMLAVEGGLRTPVLQWWFYASLLLPVTFLALAGQVSLLLDRLDERTFTRLLVGSVVGLLAAHAVTLPHERLLSLARYPVLLPLAFGLGIPLAMRLLARRAHVSVALVVASLALSGLLSRNLTWFDRPWDRLGGGRSELFRQVARAEGLARRYDPGPSLYYWWNQDDELHPLFDLVGATALSGARIVNLAFPDLQNGRNAMNLPIVPGMKVAILSRDADAAREGRAAFEAAGFVVAPLGEEEVPGPGTSFRMSFLELRGRRATGEPGAP